MNGPTFISILLLMGALILCVLELRKARKALKSLERINDRLRVDNATLRAHLQEFPRR